MPDNKGYEVNGGASTSIEMNDASSRAKANLQHEIEKGKLRILVCLDILF